MSIEEQLKGLDPTIPLHAAKIAMILLKHHLDIQDGMCCNSIQQATEQTEAAMQGMQMARVVPILKNVVKSALDVQYNILVQQVLPALTKQMEVYIASRVENEQMVAPLQRAIRVFLLGVQEHANLVAEAAMLETCTGLMTLEESNRKALWFSLALNAPGRMFPPTETTTDHATLKAGLEEAAMRAGVYADTFLGIHADKMPGIEGMTNFQVKK